MKRLACLMVLIFSAPLLALGQSKPITFKTDADVVWAGVDRAGDLFLVLTNGDVQKFDNAGKKIGSYNFNKSPTLLDPLDGVQSFYYERNGNSYGNLSADMTRVTKHTVDPAFAISPWLVCPALHELWILDSADFSIKKTQMKSTMISLEAALKHLPQKNIADYVHMREYQNYLFLLDRSAGVHVFNGIGKFIKTLGEKNLAYFNFLGEEIYFLSGNNIVLIDLYTNEKRTLPLATTCRFALFTEERQYVVSEKSVTISAFKPD